MAKQNIQEFFEYSGFYTALFPRLAAALPSMELKLSSGNWTSKHHLSGEKDGKGQITTYIYKNRPYNVHDYAQGNKGVINLYMERETNYNTNDPSDFYKAVTELCNLCGVEPPSNDSEEWSQYKAKQENRETAQRAFVAALWSGTAEATQVLDYLHGRHWKDEQIKKAELGLITPQVRASLPDDSEYHSHDYKNDKVIGEIAVTHRLTIPYRNGARLFGHKARVTEAYEGNKYLNTSGLRKGNGLFGIPYRCKDLVIVEGELDALHAKVMGFDDIAATTGGAATAEQIREAVKRGAERFTLLLDNDGAGKGFIADTFKAIREVSDSARIYLAHLPEQYKDLDEYLCDHEAQDFEAVVHAAQPYSHAQFAEIVERYANKEQDGKAEFKDRDDFINSLDELLNSPYMVANSYEREDLFKLYEQNGIEKYTLVSVSELRNWLNRSYERKVASDRTAKLREASASINELLKQGKSDEAAKLMGETASKLGTSEESAEFAKVFAPKAPNEYDTLLSEVKDGIPTGFKFEQGTQKELLTLNTGLTFICGYRGHGKTSFLNNIALNEARRNVALKNDKSVLYFSYEVDKRRLILDLLNTFVNDPDLSRNPSNTIQGYFKGKRAKYFRNERREDGKTHYENFETQKERFFREYLSTGSLVVVEENYKVEKLLRAIKSYVATHNVSIICVDYAQLIYSEDYTRQRTEEIKKVVNDIKDYANKQGIPFVMAAQFNREVDSPISVDTKNIGEGGDFERIADTCIGLFNLKELHPLPKNKDEEKEAKKLLESLGVATYAKDESLKPIQGKLFVRLMKRRYGYYPLDTVVDWEGRTKYIAPNDPDQLSTEPTQGNLFEEAETEEYAPF